MLYDLRLEKIHSDNQVFVELDVQFYFPDHVKHVVKFFA